MENVYNTYLIQVFLKYFLLNFTEKILIITKKILKIKFFVSKWLTYRKLFFKTRKDRNKIESEFKKIKKFSQYNKKILNKEKMAEKENTKKSNK